jgi:hypothetical protein
MITRERGRPYIDMTGQRFGRWLVLRPAGTNGKWGVLWLCRCDCGDEKIRQGGSLRHGLSRGCASCAVRERWEKGGFANIKLGPKPKAGLKSKSKTCDDASQQTEALA